MWTSRQRAESRGATGRNRRVATRRLLVRCACLLAVLGLQPAPLDAQIPTLKEAIAKYRAGETDAAISAFRSLNDVQLNEARRYWNRVPSNPLDLPEWLRNGKAAILLSTEIWFRLRRGGAPDDAEMYFAVARSLARSLARLVPNLWAEKPEREQEFVRVWYLLVTSFLHTEMLVGRSGSHVAEARKLFPGDAELLLASGAGHEMLSDVTAGWIQYYDTAGRRTGQQQVNTRRELVQAVRFYREAVAAAPDLDEARLRLGRTLYRLGDHQAAAEELATVHARTSAAPLKYLAAVVLGLVEAERHHAGRAAELHAEGIRLYPNGQIAFLALSELAYRSGRPAEAATIVTELLRRPEKDDPWWLYLSGESWNLNARFAALVAEVRP